MSKAEYFVQKLLNGEKVTRYKEGGNSMLPIIKSNQPVDLIPSKNVNLIVGDIVLCKVKGRYYTHKIKSIKIKGENTL